MKSKPVPHLARAVIGGVLACLVLFCAFASFSPLLHEVVHADAKAADHFCHLTIWGKGDLLASAPPSGGPHLVEVVFLSAPQAESFFSLFDALTFPPRGPPFLS